MKCETTNTVLTYVLGALALLGVIFALQTIFHTREYSTLTMQVGQANNALTRVQSLANDTLAFNQRYPNPELTRILQAVQAKPATR
jgi:hypothetical protein